MAVTLDNLTLTYNRHPAVHHVSGRFATGSLTAIVGPNGAGKSTLLKGIAGVLRSSSGGISVNRVGRARLGYLPQHQDLDRSFPIDVLDTVLLGLSGSRGLLAGLFGAFGGEDRTRAIAALAAVGLSGFEHRPIAELSAGQFQRVLFARLMVQDARLILLDEPFNAIDARTTEDLLAIVKRWHGEGRTVIAVLHDLEQVRTHFPNTLLLAREAIAWGRTADVLTEPNLTAARTLSEAWDDHAEPCAA